MKNHQTTRDLATRDTGASGVYFGDEMEWRLGMVAFVAGLFGLFGLMGAGCAPDGTPPPSGLAFAIMESWSPLDLRGALAC